MQHCTKIYNSFIRVVTFALGVDVQIGSFCITLATHITELVDCCLDELYA